MTTPDQRDIVDFLAEGAAFDGRPVRHIETHISHLFLAGNKAWKLKRDVRLSFLDFSTPELRRAACERELELNRRTAPDLYLGVVPVTWDGRTLAVGGTGEPLDWLVEMRRFDERTLLHRAARGGRLTPALAAALVERIVAFHAAAERRPDMGGAPPLRANVRDVAGNLRRYGEGLFDTAAIESWEQRIDRTLTLHAGLLETRREAGMVRHCHGDLHLANICVVDGVPVLFDCIEFNDAYACIDVLYDLAFLLMDLIFHGLAGIANLALNRYLSATRDFAGLPAMPAFLSLRAAVRAMVAAIDAADENEADPELARDARVHFDLAQRLLERPASRLVAIGGLSGSGKSTLAAALALRLAPGAGAVVVSSDVLRKRLFGKQPEEKLEASAYAPEVSARVYERLHEDVAAALAAGQVVIADATWLRAEDRAEIREVAAMAGARFTGLWLESPEQVLRERVLGRRGGPSDADAGVLATQLSQNPGNIDWERLESARPGLVTEALLAISA